MIDQIEIVIYRGLVKIYGISRYGGMKYAWVRAFRRTGAKYVGQTRGKEALEYGVV